MFGQNCAFPCHCLNEKTCDQINGRCPDNLCAPGWKGDNCSTGRRLLYRGSYMSAHALLNLLNDLGKRDKM